jgi:hypothetical protein
LFFLLLGLFQVIGLPFQWNSNYLVLFRLSKIFTKTWKIKMKLRVYCEKNELARTITCTLEANRIPHCDLNSGSFHILYQFPIICFQNVKQRGLYTQKIFCFVGWPLTKLQIFLFFFHLQSRGSRKKDFCLEQCAFETRKKREIS